MSFSMPISRHPAMPLFSLFFLSTYVPSHPTHKGTPTIFTFAVRLLLHLHSTHSSYLILQRSPCQPRSWSQIRPHTSIHARVHFASRLGILVDRCRLPSVRPQAYKSQAPTKFNPESDSTNRMYFG
ncbi:hypothetical protein M405DRAFT_384273 [Rhizopogon salebrosus TDB-379]|nr:hypothetical protein M405DRAFT_384273 [Rhizopogon salebrosus TDB-379]